MQFNIPKNDAKYHWTSHVVRKMMHYGLSADRVKRVMRSPTRSEKGIAPDTIAVMSPAGTPKRPTEIWVMYVPIRSKRSLATESRIHDFSTKSKMDLGKIGTTKKIIITAWRYPGISKIRDEIPIPADILQELKSIKY